MARVHTSSAAEEDIRDILLYTGRKDRSPEGALKLYEALREAFDRHALNPAIAQARPDLGPDLRLFSCGTKSNPHGWVVIYRPIENGIHVLRVFRASQDYDQLF